MDWNRKIAGVAVLAMSVWLWAGCSISYSFTGAGSLDYSKYKTISIADFPIRSDYVYAPLGTTFNQELKDIFIRQTRLTMANAGADLEIEGEITGYNQYNEAVAADGYASSTKLTVTVNVRFTDNINHNNDFERQFSAFRTYDSRELLTAVQDELIAQMVKEITDQIFMATVANW
ncbi:MAG: LPS assembly lipoprotein LptE [Mediterranea sp.]|jgi:hypothetical protein|nr:LPS assembly lipoprotein LptE [Mediterranea sp.]